MEVLSVSPPSVNAFSSAPPRSAPSRRTSLLDRRADHSDVPLSRNATLAITQTVPLAASTLRPARQPSRSALRFVPLTPIMASPRLTPEPSQASAPSHICETRGFFQLE
ncbi:hypothetical protein A0H81_09695 [Grifola frondosa]|uniref:Uncharacterized protein n=1 Tax=Grifola frondosa TaxID=5627 RepID=A0A1C7M1A6_GRIFR|nr:hypothetical protein A0H81_09695 [Grifola frondosa]